MLTILESSVHKLKNFQIEMFLIRIFIYKQKLYKFVKRITSDATLIELIQQQIEQHGHITIYIVTYQFLVLVQKYCQQISGVILSKEGLIFATAELIVKLEQFDQIVISGVKFLLIDPCQVCA